MQTIHIGVLSASDRASKGIYEDLSGKAIQEVLSEYLLNPLEFHYEIVADERDLIEKSLIKMCDEYQCDLVVTTGGTGPRECLEAVFPAIPYCVDLILGNYMQVNEKNIQAFRPKQ